MGRKTDPSTAGGWGNGQQNLKVDLTYFQPQCMLSNIIMTYSWVIFFTFVNFSIQIFSSAYF
jgi:hypothetical protein